MTSDYLHVYIPAVLRLLLDSNYGTPYVRLLLGFGLLTLFILRALGVPLHLNQ
jgi:hypothetical protein